MRKSSKEVVLEDLKNFGKHGNPTIRNLDESIKRYGDKSYYLPAILINPPLVMLDIFKGKSWKETKPVLQTVIMGIVSTIGIATSFFATHIWAVVLFAYLLLHIIFIPFSIVKMIDVTDKKYLHIDAFKKFNKPMYDLLFMYLGRNKDFKREYDAFLHDNNEEVNKLLYDQEALLNKLGNTIADKNELIAEYQSENTHLKAMNKRLIKAMTSNKNVKFNILGQPYAIYKQYDDENIVRDDESPLTQFTYPDIFNKNDISEIPLADIMKSTDNNFILKNTHLAFKKRDTIVVVELTQELAELINKGKLIDSKDLLKLV